MSSAPRLRHDYELTLLFPTPLFKPCTTTSCWFDKARSCLRLELAFLEHAYLFTLLYGLDLHCYILFLF